LLSDNPSQLMACFVELSSNKERTTLEKSVVKIVCQLLKCELHLLHLYDRRGEFTPQVSLRGKAGGEVVFDDSSPEQLKPGLLQDISEYLKLLKDQSAEQIYQQNDLVFWPLYSGESCLDLLIFTHSRFNEIDLTLLNAISCIFSNFLVLLEASERDALTGLYNRRMFDIRLSTLVRNTVSAHNVQAERRHKEYSTSNFLGIIDIDFFKRVNDNFGHLFGDEVLLWIAQNMRQCFRNEDALFRYGGEEFAVLLTGLTQQQAQDTFERFRRTIATTEFPQIGIVTVSIGYAHIDHQANPTLVFGSADKALYYAKEHGRDRVESYQKLVKDNLIEDETSESAEIEIF
jgi:diguanylate cyclase (GGDEF)-like protein